MGDEYPCPHCGAMNRERTDYLRITCRVCGGQYEARHLVSSTSIAELAKQAREEQQPMSDARLEEIRERTDKWDFAAHELIAEVESLRPALESALQLASRQDDELQRLRAREAALVEVVQKAMPFLQELATAHVSMLDEYDVLIKVSPGRAAWVISRNHVFVDQARALLASADEADARAAE